MNGYLHYKPRLARAERCRASLAGQLKQARVHIEAEKEKDVEIAKLKACHEKEMAEVRASTIPLANAIPATSITTTKLNHEIKILRNRLAELKVDEKDKLIAKLNAENMKLRNDLSVASIFKP